MADFPEDAAILCCKTSARPIDTSVCFFWHYFLALVALVALVASGVCLLPGWMAQQSIETNEICYRAAVAPGASHTVKAREAQDCQS